MKRSDRRRRWRRSWRAWLRDAPPDLVARAGPASWWDLVPAALVFAGALLVVLAAVVASSGCGSAAANKRWAVALVRCATAVVGGPADGGSLELEPGDLVEGARDAGVD